ncbi:MAG: hypothetical protein C0469_17675 [Cyanobacteria bacterium DS2.3.42]|nr:hypothetical protein [Cyanobacteria bacterium DS2.3.42]
MAETHLDTPNVKFKRRIFTKGLMLVFVPLFLETCLLLLVGWSSQQAELALVDQRNSLEQTIHANRLIAAGTVGYGYYCRYLISRDDKSREKGEHFVQIALAEFKVLLALAGDDEERKRAAREVYELAVPEMEKLKWLRPWVPGESAEEPFRQLRSARSLVFSAYENYKRFYAISLSEQDRLTKSIEKERNIRENTKRYVYWGMALNIVVGIVLLFVFNKEIAERMAILIENAVKLPKRVPLEKEILGDDEFAYLDHIMHRASAQLNKAAQFRKHLMEMVAHDMRSPLSAVSLSLAVLDKSDGEKMEEEAKPLLNQGIENVERLIALVNDLLTIEKLAANVTEVTAVGVESFDQDSHAGIHELTQLMKLELTGQSAERVEQEKRFRPGIFNKAMMLVIVPLTLATMLLTMIGGVINEQEAALLIEHKQTEIATHINRMMSMGVVSYGFMGNYLLYGKTQDHNQGLYYRNMAEREFDSLYALVKDDPEMTKLLVRLRKLGEIEFNRFVEMRPYMSQGDTQDEMELYNSVMPFWKFAIHRQEEFLKLSEEEQTRLKSARQSQAQQHQRVENIVTGGLIGSLFLSLILVFLFARDISSRMQSLTYNSTRLPIREPLKPQVPGTDEISYLDFVLHDVAEQLDQVWKQRTTIMRMVARDLREPLILVQGTLRALYGQVSTDISDLGVRQLNSARANVDRMLGLVDDLLTIENLESGRIELSLSDFDVIEAIDQSITSVQSLALQKKVTLANKAKACVVTADRQRLVQVLVNYLGNAISHSPPDTTVSVTTVTTSYSTEIHVNDAGPGLSDELKVKVFDRFFQAPDSKTRGKGYGLGLAICKMIVAAHGGQVGVIDSESGGCAFWLRLPKERTNEDF